MIKLNKKPKKFRSKIEEVAFKRGIAPVMIRIVSNRLGISPEKAADRIEKQITEARESRWDFND